jgi:ABC-type Fe3+-hydroxamate transport system substrate-binding protein
MKLFGILFLAFVFTSISLVNSSCSKTNTVTDTVSKTITVTDTVTKIVVDTLKPPTTIVGVWVGTYQITGLPTSYYYSFDLRPDGTLLHKGTGADGNTYYGQGRYTVNGTAFSYSDTVLNLGQTGTVETGSGTYSAADSTITGNLENDGGVLTGSFSVMKKE